MLILYPRIYSILMHTHDNSQMLKTPCIQVGDQMGEQEQDSHPMYNMYSVQSTSSTDRSWFLNFNYIAIFI